MRIHLFYMVVIISFLLFSTAWRNHHDKAFKRNVAEEFASCDTTHSQHSQQLPHFEYQFTVNDVRQDHGAKHGKHDAKPSSASFARQMARSRRHGSSWDESVVEGGGDRERHALLIQASQFANTLLGERYTFDVTPSGSVMHSDSVAQVLRALETIMVNHHNFSLSDSIKAGQLLADLTPDPEVQATVVTTLFDKSEFATELGTELIVDVVADIGLRPKHLDYVEQLMEDGNEFIAQNALRAMINMIHELDEERYASEISRATHNVTRTISERPELALSLLY